MKIKTLIYESKILPNKDTLSPFVIEITKYFNENGINVKPFPKVHIKVDEENAKKALGKTAYYDPNQKSVTLYTSGRHIKDVLRSYAHELVHHNQNLKGTLHNIQTSDVNEDDKLEALEKEAYLNGNILFRKWENSLTDG